MEEHYTRNELVTVHLEDAKPPIFPGVVVREEDEHIIVRAHTETWGDKEFPVSPLQLTRR